MQSESLKSPCCLGHNTQCEYWVYLVCINQIFLLVYCYALHTVLASEDFQPIVLLHSMIGYWHHRVVRLSSVRLYMSVCLSVGLSLLWLSGSVSGSGAHKLEILETNCTTISPTSSLFAAQRSSTYSQGKVRKFGRSGVGKTDVLERKSGNNLRHA